MKVIFLDIDGVLNCKKTPNPRKLPYIVDKRLLRRFKQLLARTNAKVVLSSSWRVDPVGLFAAKHWGVPFIDICPNMPKSPRSREVLIWLKRVTPSSMTRTTTWTNFRCFSLPRPRALPRRSRRASKTI